MTEEEKKAIEMLKRIDVKFLLNGSIEQSNFIIDEADKVNNSIETVLNLIQKKDTEINKLNNVIDRMAGEFEQTCKSINEEYAVDEVFLDKEKIKEYFMKEDE